MTSLALIEASAVTDALQSLKAACDTLQKVDAQRLLGDRIQINGAILALLIVSRRVDRLADKQEARELQAIREVYEREVEAVRHTMAAE